MLKQESTESTEQYTFDKFEAECYTWNMIARNARGATTVTYEDIKNQLNLIKEELEETIRDLENQDVVGVLDGYTDIRVTLAGFGQQLQMLGLDILSACKETNKNNYTKFVKANDKNTIDETIKKYKKEGIEVTPKYDQLTNTVVFLDTNNKVRKPYGFVSNDLSKFTEGVVL